MRTSFDTRDFELARTVLVDVYGDHVPVLRGERGSFALSKSTVQAEGLGLDTLFYGGLVENDFVPRDDMLIVGLMREGRLSCEDGSQEHTLARDELYWFQPGTPQRQTTADVGFDVARLDVADLARIAAGLGDLEPERVRFHPRRHGAPTRERLRYWDSSRRWLAEHVLADDVLAAEPLVRAETFRLLAVATLMAVPNTALDRLIDPTVRVPTADAPATVRRAVAFIEEHAARNIGLREIAGAARVTPRALQASFRRHRDETPLEHLRRVRLAAAHRDLQAADPTRGDTIAAIAARWGFGHPGRFSVYYRRAYGGSPGETLRR